METETWQCSFAVEISTTIEHTHVGTAYVEITLSGMMELYLLFASFKEIQLKVGQEQKGICPEVGDNTLKWWWSRWNTWKVHFKNILKSTCAYNEYRNINMVFFTAIHNFTLTLTFTASFVILRYFEDNKLVENI